ncbi:MAG: mercury resistance system periplasmic binding protein MerP [Rhodospirillales bacterium]|nr:mercury resistance system periplasmic binding protein MerP [Rhodospirillales bacterium]
MKRKLACLILGVALLSGNAAMAANRTATLAVDNMTCASCPYIVKKTLASVPGVSKVDVSFEKKIAVVTFDDARTTLDELTSASARAGFPARPVTGNAR